MIVDLVNMVYLSLVSVWEIVIKCRVGKFDFEGLLFDVVEFYGFIWCDIIVGDVEYVGEFDWYYWDFFDCMLVV